MWLLYTLPLTGFWIFVVLFMALTLGPYDAGYMLGQFSLVFLLLWSWPMMAVNIKRGHDLGWPAWRVFLLAGLTGPLCAIAVVLWISIQINHDIAVQYADFGDTSRPEPGPLTVSSFWLPISLFCIASTAFTVWTVAALFFKGQTGANHYGVDPLNLDGETIDAFA